MTTSKAQLRAQKKYDKDNTVQIKLKLNKKTDSDIIEALKTVSNKQGLIKDLLRLRGYGNRDKVRNIQIGVDLSMTNDKCIVSNRKL